MKTLLLNPKGKARKAMAAKKTTKKATKPARRRNPRGGITPVVGRTLAGAALGGALGGYLARNVGDLLPLDALSKLGAYVPGIAGIALAAFSSGTMARGVAAGMVAVSANAITQEMLGEVGPGAIAYGPSASPRMLPAYAESTWAREAARRAAASSRALESAYQPEVGRLAAAGSDVQGLHIGSLVIDIQD